VVVLDPRIVTKPYGRSFLRALPAGVAIKELK
jgi:Rad3-related DNA helicase